MEIILFVYISDMVTIRWTELATISDNKVGQG